MPQQAQPYAYEIFLKETINQHWLDWFEGVLVACQENGGTVLTITLPDQSALRGLLNQLFDLNLTIISLTYISIANEINRSIYPSVDDGHQG